MRERARRLLGGAARVLHRDLPLLGLRFLRRHAAAARLDPALRDRRRRGSARPRQGGDGGAGVSEQVLSPGAVRARISQAKNALVTPRSFEAVADGLRGRADREGLPPLRKTARRVRRARLRRPDRPPRAAAALAVATLLAAERRRIRHLLIDEYQDTNGVAGRARQAARRRAPTPSAPSATRTRRSTAGAARRSSTSSASTQDFPAPAVVALERNYRSTAGILEAASALVSPQPAPAAEDAARRPGPRRRASGSGDSTEDRAEAERDRARDRRRGPAAVATWPSSTAPTPSRAPSKRSSCAGGFPTSSSAA